MLSQEYKHTKMSNHRIKVLFITTVSYEMITVNKLVSSSARGWTTPHPEILFVHFFFWSAGLKQ